MHDTTPRPPGNTITITPPTGSIKCKPDLLAALIARHKARRVALECLNSWRRVLASVSDVEARWRIFEDAATDMAQHIGDGWPRPMFADALREMALAHGLIELRGEDEVQAVVADAIEAAAEQVPPDDAFAQYDEQAQAAAAPALPPLPFVDMSAWDDTPPPPRQWLVIDHIPLRQPTLISGEGAIGKSILLLQLLASTTLSREWIGTLFPKPGPTIYLGAEDDQDEIHRRLAAILEHHEMRFSDLIAGGFKALAFAGKDAVLAEFDHRTGRIRPTDLFAQLYHEACALQPSAIVIDPVSDVFLGDEIKRDQVRQFGSLMRRLAIESTSAVVIASHPSQSGMKSGTGTSGSTQWHNTVRARAYFRKVTSADDEADDYSTPDDGQRVLEFKKNQYGPLGHTIRLEWHRGLWLPPSAKTKGNKTVAHAKADEMFLTLLRRFAAQGRRVSPNRSPTYAPTESTRQPEAKAAKMNVDRLAEAMDRLLASNRIEVIPDGPPSRRRQMLIEVTRP